MNQPAAKLSAKEAAERLAALAKDELGVTIYADDILYLFEKHWSRLNGWSHAIHDEQQANRKLAADYARKLGQQR